MSRKRQNQIAAATEDHLSPKPHANTPEEIRRKGRFLVKQFSSLKGPLLTSNGKSTVLALSALKWGEPVPKNIAAAHRLAKKGAVLLKQAHRDLAKHS